MAKVTLTIDDEVLQRARARAREQGTSVHALVGEYLERYARDDERKSAAVRELLALSRSSAASSGVRGRSWTRDDAYGR